MELVTNDYQLWEDFKKGEKYALSHIYYLYVDQLFRYGKKFSPDNDLVKDIIQDLFFDLIRTRSNLGTTDHIYFYLIKAFRRKLLLSLKSPKNLRQTEEQLEMLEANIVYSVEEDWIQKEQLSKKEEIVRKGLTQLSPKQREILYYRFTCDFEYDQICEIMSMKNDSARKMVYRGLQTLREHLSDMNITLLSVHLQSIIFLRKK